VVLTYYHVVSDTSSINVTFIYEKEYSASIQGLNQYADLAVLSTYTPKNNYQLLEIVGSTL
jgi:S1-C subfamily serine protease